MNPKDEHSSAQQQPAAEAEFLARYDPDAFDRPSIAVDVAVSYTHLTLPPKRIV